ncbi:MAG TPA: aminopeptidase [Anaerolineales bacterium]|nr:aminopeptidase [Anaerolineales bacterium]
MADPRITRLAHVLSDYCLDVQPGQVIVVTGSPLADPLLRAVYQRILERGAQPLPQIFMPGLNELYIRHAHEAVLDRPNPLAQHLYETIDGIVQIRSTSHTRELASVDPARLKRSRAAEASIVKTFMDRSSRGELRWVIAQFPTDAQAQDADMGPLAYEEFVYRACHVDGDDDPVAYWQSFRASQQRICDWLKGRKTVTVRSANVDLKLSIDGRVFINADGRNNMPDGEVFTGPVEESVEGWIRFTYPAIFSGREVDGVELRFESGRVVKADARKDPEFLQSVLDTDAGARYLGEFAIGTNYGVDRFTRNILFDEKIGGTLHLALGASYPGTGAKNESSVHWDMVCDMREDSEIAADGEVFYRNGRLVI